MRIALGLLLLSCLALCACKESDKDKITRLVKEWEGREIIFPNDIVFTRFVKDTVEHQLPSADYTIIYYIDSVGCTSCKLHLSRWKELMNEFDSVPNKQVSFFFAFHPKDKRELIYNLKRDSFDYPVWIDIENRFNQLNNFPKEEAFHVFLVNEQKKVVAIGNPLHNPKIKELYLGIILDKEIDTKSTPKTKIEILQTSIDLGTFDWKIPQEASFVLKNSGSNPLVVNDILSSCGCIKVDYLHNPIRSGDSLVIRVTYKADKPEYFDKTLSVYCNVDKALLKLKIRGQSEE